MNVLAVSQCQAVKAKGKKGECFCYCGNQDLDYFGFTKEFREVPLLEAGTDQAGDTVSSFIAVFYCC